MDLKDYYHKLFNTDINQLHTVTPNDVILEHAEEFFVHKEIKFFGGKDWEGFDADTNGIDHLEEFLITLFIMSTVDYFIKNNLELYKKIYQKHDYPKLGWSGYGPHFEHPYKIYSKRKEVFNELHRRKVEIVPLFKEIIKDYNGLYYESFITKVINNETNSIDQYGGFLELLNESEEKVWKDNMEMIFK